MNNNKIKDSKTKYEIKNKIKNETKYEIKNETKNETKNKIKNETKYETKYETKNKTKYETKNKTKYETKNKTTKKIKINKIKKQVGGNIIRASIQLVDSLISFGDSVFSEINYITDIKKQMGEGASAKQGVPNVIEGPPKFNAPKLPLRKYPEKIFS